MTRIREWRQSVRPGKGSFADGSPSLRVPTDPSQSRIFPGRFATQFLSGFRIGSSSHLPILRPQSRNPAKLRLGIPKKAAGEGLSIIYARPDEPLSDQFCDERPVTVPTIGDQLRFLCREPAEIVSVREFCRMRRCEGDECRVRQPSVSTGRPVRRIAGDEVRRSRLPSAGCRTGCESSAGRTTKPGIAGASVRRS